jgi:hypothetical protein
MDVLKDEPDSCSETCSVSSDDGNQVVHIKLEGDTDIKEEEEDSDGSDDDDNDDSEQIISPVTGTESEVSCVPERPALCTFHSCPELPVVSLVSTLLASCAH